MRRSIRDELLLALADALLGPVAPPPSETGFLATLDALIARLPRRERRALDLLLTFHRFAPVLRTGRGLRSLSAQACAAHLDRFTRSRFGFLRRSVRVVHSLVSFAYYGQPAAWPSIGYGGPWLGRIDVEKLPDPYLQEGGPVDPTGS